MQFTNDLNLNYLINNLIMRNQSWLDKFNPKTTKILFQIDELFLNGDYSFYNRTKYNENFYEAKLNLENNLFRLFDLKNTNNEKKFQIRLDITDNNSIDTDFIKNNKKQSNNTFEGHHSKKLINEDPSFFKLELKLENEIIICCKIKIGLKSFTGKFSDILNPKDSLKIYLRKKGSIEWNIAREINQEGKQII